MELELYNYLEQQGANRDNSFVRYKESINKDALTEAWLENRTSYIWKVGVLTLIDNNKADFIHVAIGTQRMPQASPVVVGYFHFKEGENDDPTRVIERAVNLLADMHPEFL